MTFSPVFSPLNLVSSLGSSLGQAFTVLLILALVGGLGFFVYNWWKCRRSRVLQEEYGEDLEDQSQRQKNDKEGPV
jgi:hypothetical protein